MRYSYSAGYLSYDAARESLDDSIAHGDVSESESPMIAPYYSKEGPRKFHITLAH